MLPAAFGPGARRRDPPPLPALRSGRGAPSGSPRPRAGRGLRLLRYAVCGRPRRFPARPFFAGGRPAGRPAAGRPRRYRLRAAPRAAPRALRGFGVVGPSARAWRYPPRWTRSPSARSCRASRPAVALRRARVPPVGAAPPGALGGGAPGRGARAVRRRPQAAWVRRCRPARAPGPLFLFSCCGFRPAGGARGPKNAENSAKTHEKPRKQAKIVEKPACCRYNECG